MENTSLPLVGGNSESPCPFCVRMRQASDLPRNDLAAAVVDAFPRAPGHILIVPFQHVADYFELSSTVQASLWELVPKVHAWQKERFSPSGWTVRINSGSSAGQSIFHVHLHVLPSYGDVQRDPFKHQEPL